MQPPFPAIQKCFDKPQAIHAPLLLGWNQYCVKPFERLVMLFRTTIPSLFWFRASSSTLSGSITCETLMTVTAFPNSHILVTDWMWTQLLVQD